MLPLLEEAAAEDNFPKLQSCWTFLFIFIVFIKEQKYYFKVKFCLA